MMAESHKHADNSKKPGRAHDGGYFSTPGCGEISTLMACLYDGRDNSKKTATVDDFDAPVRDHPKRADDAGRLRQAAS